MPQYPKLFPAGTVQDLANERDVQHGPMPTKIPFDHYVVSGAQALEILKALRTSPKNGYPFIAGDAFSVSRLVESYEFNSETSENTLENIIKTSLAFDALAWFEQRMKEEQEYEDQDFPFPPRGEIDKPVEPQSSLIAHLDVLSGEPFNKVFVGVVPISTQDAWRVFAYLKFGNWNECPPPSVHCAIHRYWAEQFGASPATLAYDTVEVYVDRPIQNQGEAEKTALQQYLYCSDIIDQGYGTLDGLAASLIGAKTWYFWWD